MKKRRKNNLKYQFDKETMRVIYYRDNGTCIFCKIGYHMENKDQMLYEIKDVMHFINKSQGGLGVARNGAIGCRYHHGLLDNGNKGLRQEMLELFEKHLLQQYQDWNKKDLVFKKWDFPAF